MRLKTIKFAFIKSIPVCAGYIFLGMGFGILLRNAGYGVIWAFCMSLFIYAGVMQYVGVNLLASNASIITTAVTTFMVNARHLFYSIAMIARYSDTNKYNPYLYYGLTDETYSLLCDCEIPEGLDKGEYLFYVTLFNHSYWILGGVLGNILGSVLPFSFSGVEFSMTAIFVASFTEQCLNNKDHLPAITGTVSTLTCLIIFGRDNFLIPAMLIITAVLLIFGKKRGEL